MRRQVTSNFKPECAKFLCEMEETISDSYLTLLHKAKNLIAVQLIALPLRIEGKNVTLTSRPKIV